MTKEEVETIDVVEGTLAAHDRGRGHRLAT